MDLSGTISIIVGIITIGSQIFIIGSFWGKIKEKDEVQDKKIEELREKQERDIIDTREMIEKKCDNINNWIREHELYHRDKDEKLNEKISNIDKNVSVLMERITNIKKNNK